MCVEGFMNKVKEEDKCRIAKSADRMGSVRGVS